MSLSESGRIQQPVKQGFFDQFVLCVAYGIWRWRAETGRVNTNEEEMERRVDHHFAWMLVSREYYVPSYYQGSLRLARDRHVVTPESQLDTLLYVSHKPGHGSTGLWQSISFRMLLSPKTKFNSERQNCMRPDKSSATPKTGS
ncbi:MAG: hypothetical protein UT27_C0004G0029 [Candidatus Nomurabacteria bacterium GW2011_GWD2_39_12]|uniref:Uncharacterized protein n=1 Tax=Candidatus Nomurabacteria bacterium GW2011_GWD2_39_12 TaxID=1618759 RepID=A0A837HSU3_9BACT|nr:MAG: hypothetical protein UT27_C0004G0029 [Candidatus Nomurabacteria bacterium GW2011_GWD2_39_12]